MAITVGFGTGQHNILTITVSGRAYRHSVDYWDGNWLLVEITIQVGSFSGRVPGMLRAEELAAFRQQLDKFGHTLTGAVVFTTAESWFALNIEAGKPGYVSITGSVSDNVGVANRLTFTLQVAESALGSTVRQLQQVVTAYPVVGKPEI